MTCQSDLQVPLPFVDVLSSRREPKLFPVYLSQNPLPTLAVTTLSTQVSHQHDEDFINRSLLDSLDAQADAEPARPTATADPDHQSLSSFQHSSDSSPSSTTVAYSIPLHPHHQHLTPTDSPHEQAILHHLHSQDAQYSTHSLQGAPYTHPSNIHTHQDFPNEFETTKIPQQHSSRMNGFAANNNFRASFNAFPNTNRPQTNPNAIGQQSLRDIHAFYPTSADIFPNQVASPIHPHLQQYDSNFEFGGHKPFPDNFGPNGPMAPHHPNRNGVVHPPQAPHHKFNSNPQFGNPVQLTSQTPYGPHVPISGTNTGSNPPQAPNAPPPPRDAAHATSTTNGPNQEEISTIFVVGFPEDMQEREFQNMFTFSAGFEAATLKIPNKEYTSYGANGVRPFPGYNGSNDPYNLVTVNQGGVVVDGGRDGTMSSWPAGAGAGDDAGNHFVGTSLAPRKQIIGFAKFKSREAAQEARDLLQGRRVDIEKGAVLKAEMAKKNLHTKRGVGPVAGPAAPPSMNPSTSMQGASHGHGPAPNHTNDTFSGDVFPPRERDLPLGGLDLGRLGTFRDQLQKDVAAMTNGLGSAQTAEFHPRKEREDDEFRRRERDANMFGAMGFGTGSPVTRGPRERVEEEQRERKARLRATNSTAFDAFHSVPAGNAPPLSRQNSGLNGIMNGTSLMPVMEGSSSPHLGNGFSSNQHDEVVGPWSKIQNVNAISRPRSSSQRSISPPDFSAPSESETESPGRPKRTASESSASSVTGSQPIGIIGGGKSTPIVANETDLNKVMTDLVLNTDDGTTSPQLPSPASGSSSTGTKGAVDQNPPINTLYVGNLPASAPSIGFSNDHLEESIRQLFASQPGYRRLVFRQKNNGPMCFVEFEDVHYATKALSDLYGHTLNGLVKGGGIRLSYSKNPLGVRTPTNSGNNPSLQQQQQSMHINFQSDAFQSRSGDDPGPQSHISRRDVSGHFGNSFLASPPPRFTSPPITSFNQTSLASGYNIRTNAGNLSGMYPFSLAHAGGPSPSNFSPFGISAPPSIPEHHSSSDDQPLHISHHHFSHRTMSPPVNVEATRAG